jgi:hypothetical protein
MRDRIYNKGELILTVILIFFSTFYGLILTPLISREPSKSRVGVDIVLLLICIYRFAKHILSYRVTLNFFTKMLIAIILHLTFIYLTQSAVVFFGDKLLQRYMTGALISSTIIIVAELYHYNKSKSLKPKE